MYQVCSGAWELPFAPCSNCCRRQVKRLMGEPHMGCVGREACSYRCERLNYYAWGIFDWLIFALLEQIKGLVKSSASVSSITGVSDEEPCFSAASVQISLWLLGISCLRCCSFICSWRTFLFPNLHCSSWLFHPCGFSKIFLLQGEDNLLFRLLKVHSSFGCRGYDACIKWSYCK